MRNGRNRSTPRFRRNKKGTGRRCLYRRGPSRLTVGAKELEHAVNKYGHGVVPMEWAPGSKKTGYRCYIPGLL